VIPNPRILIFQCFRLILLGCIAVISMQPALAQNRKDTIFFLNGSRVIGEVDKINLGVLNFDPDDANDITVQLQKLKTIAAVRTIFRIETTNHQVYFGRLVPHDSSQMVWIAQAHDSIAINIREISFLYAYKSRFLQRFSGSMGAGFSYTKSSSFGQLNFNGKLNYVTRKDEISLSTAGIYSITDSSFVQDRQDASLKYNLYFSPTWFATTFLAYQHNLELGLQRRWQEGLGIGNKYITSRHVYAWARTGLVLNQEKNIENVSTGTLTELFGQLEFNFFRFTKPEVHFIFEESFYYGLTQAGRIRNDADVTLIWEIFKDFDLNISVYTNFDNQPPGGEGKTTDFGATLGLSFTF